jgi:hypothetical protein
MAQQTTRSCVSMIKTLMSSTECDGTTEPPTEPPDPWAMVTRDQKIIVGEVPLHYAAHAPVPSSA